VERKNGWQLAEEAGESTPYGMQYLLDRAVLESDDLRDQLCQYVKNTTLVILRRCWSSIKLAFSKKGAGRLVCSDNTAEPPDALSTVKSVFSGAFASLKGHTLLDRELYLP
jgi:hypothetical protein